MKRFKPTTEGLIGISAGSDARTLEVSDWMIFQEIPDNNAGWYMVKLENPPRAGWFPVEGGFSRPKQEYINWSGVVFCFPKETNGAKNLYAQFEEI